MIHINATIVIQALNFFIVYWMLRYFLFRPVVTIIDHEYAQRALMITSIEQQKKSLEIQEKERKRCWFMCQEYFSANRPSADMPESFITQNLILDSFPYQVSADSIRELVVDTYPILEEKIKNVH